MVHDTVVALRASTWIGTRTRVSIHMHVRAASGSYCVGGSGSRRCHTHPAPLLAAGLGDVCGYSNIHHLDQLLARTLLRSVRAAPATRAHVDTE